MRHCEKAFCIENMLFVTLMIQLKQWMTDNGLTSTQQTESGTSEIYGILEQQPIQLPHNVPISSIINIANKNIKINKDTNNGDVHNDKILVVYKQFCFIYQNTYKQYIEDGIAPFEINISFDDREQCKLDYLQTINGNDEFVYQSFLEIWSNLVKTTDSVFELLIFLTNQLKIDSE